MLLLRTNYGEIFLPNPSGIRVKNPEKARQIFGQNETQVFVENGLNLSIGRYIHSIDVYVCYINSIHVYSSTFLRDYTRSLLE